MPIKKNTSIKNSWDLVGDDDYASRVKEALLSGKNNKSRILSEVDDIRSHMLKIPEFGLQATFNLFGLMHGRIIDVLATDGIGKTTLLFTIAGWAIKQNSPVYYQETENKLMSEDRIRRCLSTDKALAAKYFNRLIIDQAFEIQTAISSIENFVHRSRDPNSPIYVPSHIPLVIMQDTFSKLMSKDEAEGVIAYGESKVEEAKEVGGGSNFVAAKTAHAWFRRLPHFLHHYNAILIFTRHQNDKVDMSAGKFGGGSMATSDTHNRTSRGGKAFNQNASLQLILSRIQAVSAKINGVDEKIGVKGQINVVKNSYGPGDRKFFYQINTVPRFDTETYQEPSITFAPYTAEWLVLKKLLPITMKNKNCFTCKELKLYDASADEVHQALHADTALMERLGTQLDIRGYSGQSKELPSETPSLPSTTDAPDNTSTESDTVSSEKSAESVIEEEKKDTVENVKKKRGRNKKQRPSVAANP